MPVNPLPPFVPPTPAPTTTTPTPAVPNAPPPPPFPPGGAFPPSPPVATATIPGPGSADASALAVASTKTPDLNRQFIAALSGDSPSTRSSDGSWNRGWIIVTPEAIPNGVRVHVESGHNKEKDVVKLSLQARVRATVPHPMDPNQKITEEHVVDLELLHDGVLNTGPEKFDHVVAYDIDYAKLQARLTAMAPNAKLVLDGNTPLAVQAQWSVQQNGNTWNHNWGGFDRNGVFFLPYAGATTVETTGNADAINGPMPLDIGVKLDDQMVAQYTQVDPATGEFTSPLLQGGQFMSRVESEVKVAVPFDQGKNVAARLFELVKLVNNPEQAKAETVKLFGEGWTIGIEDVKRFYNFDAEGKIVVDEDGLPEMNPMLDRYYDSADGKLAEKGIALRFRETPKDTAGLVNIKLPSPADLPNETGLVGLIGRYDSGIQTTKGTRARPQTLQAFFNSDDNLNAFRHVRTLIPNLKAEEVLKPAMDLSAHRYKLLLKHDNGTDIEISLDHVSAIAIDDQGKARVDGSGKPMVATFWQLELDLEHLQTQSTNVTLNGSGSASANSFQHNYAMQEAWLQTLDTTATLSGPPRVHKPSDVANPSIIKSDAYKLLLDIGPKLHQWLLPGVDVKPATQKYATAARLTQIVPLDEATKAQMTREVEVSQQWRDEYTSTLQTTEARITRLLADARTAGRALGKGAAVLRNEYQQLSNQLYGVMSAVNMAWNARVIDVTAQSDKVDDAFEVYEQVLTNIGSAQAYYKLKAAAVGVTVVDDTTTVATLTEQLAAVKASHARRIARYAESQTEVDPERRAAIIAEAEGPLTQAYVVAFEAYRTSAQAAMEMKAVSEMKAAMTAKAEHEATLLRSDSGWASLDKVA